jgi:hypothetical protein
LFDNFFIFLCLCLLWAFFLILLRGVSNMLLGLYMLIFENMSNILLHLLYLYVIYAS